MNPRPSPRLARCRFHPERPAAAVCRRCAAAFCRECVTEEAGAMICGPCLRGPAEAAAAVGAKGLLLHLFLTLACLALLFFMFFFAARWLALLPGPSSELPRRPAPSAASPRVRRVLA